MLRTKKPGTLREFPKRELPFDEKGLVDFLVKETGDYWGHMKPSAAQLANFAIEGGTFLSLHARAPFLDSTLSGSRLTDLGAGDSRGMEAFSAVYDVREYVAVDRYCPYPWSSERIRYVNADMLQYLAEQLDGSTNVCMNAMDNLRHGNQTILASYVEMLLRQIARAIPPGGIAFGIQTPILQGLANFGFSRIEELGDRRVGSFGAVYQKP
jgi:hypothetical protein